MRRWHFVLVKSSRWLYSGVCNLLVRGWTRFRVFPIPDVSRVLGNLEISSVLGILGILGLLEIPEVPGFSGLNFLSDCARVHTLD